MAEPPLGETPYLILDARDENVRHGGQVIPCAVLVAIGIDPKGRRSIQGVGVSLSEAEAHWRDSLTSLVERGLHGAKLAVSDCHAGLKEALDARLTGVPRQRCQPTCRLRRHPETDHENVVAATTCAERTLEFSDQFLLIENTLAFVPKPSMRKAVVASLRADFDAPDRPEAQRQLDIAVKKHARGRQRWPSGWSRTCRRGWRSSPCRLRIGDGCGRFTCWSGATRS
jgi:putative transposase